MSNIDDLLARHCDTIWDGRSEFEDQTQYDEIIQTIYKAATEHINHKKVAATIGFGDPNKQFYGCISAEGFVNRLVFTHLRW